MDEQDQIDLILTETYQSAYVYGNGTEKRISIRKMVTGKVNQFGQTKVVIEVLVYSYQGTGKYEKEIKRVSTDVWVNPKNWNKKKQEVLPKEADYLTKNKEIDKVYVAVKSYVDSKGQQKPEQVYVEAFNASSLKDIFPKKPSINRKCLVDYITDYAEFRKKTSGKGTYKEFFTCRNRLKTFDERRGKRTYFEDINFTWSDELYLHLISEKVNNKPKYTSGTIEKTFSVLVTTLNYYYKRRTELKINLADTFREKGFKHGKKSVNEANPLTAKQLRLLIDYDFTNDSLNRTKDRFLIQCTTGVRYQSIFIINKNVIHKNRLIFKPEKTERFNVIVDQPLNTHALAVLRKYDFDTTSLLISAQKYNDQIKEIFKILIKEYPKAGFKDNYTSHNGRDKFISLCVQGSVDFKTILKWTGQSSYKIMDRYIKVTPQYEERKMKDTFKF